MEKEIKLTKRLRGLLCLVISMTMVFAMTLGVHAEQNSYQLGADASPTFNAYFINLSDNNNVSEETILNKGDQIFVYTSGGCTNIIYVNGTESYKYKGSGHTDTYTIPATTDTYHFSYSNDDSTCTATLHLTSIGLPQPALQQNSSHNHSYSWQTVKEATETEDGEEIYICSCGDIVDRRSISATGTYWTNCENKLKNAKTGDSVLLESGLWHSFSKKTMQEIANRRDIDVVITLTYKGVNYKITIPKGTKFDTSLDWYGPEKLKQMFGYIVVE